MKLTYDTIAKMAFDLANGLTVITPAAQQTVGEGGRE